MSNLTSQLLVRLVDGVSGPARVAARSLAVLQQAGKATQALGTMSALQRNAKGVVRNTKEVGQSVSAPLALLGALGAKTAFEFEKAGNFMEALGEATGEQRKEFEVFANTLNAKYPQSLTEVLKTGTELLKAGLDWKQMMGAMDPTLATAILGDMKPSEVATMISASLNAFQMPMENFDQALKSTTTVADRLTYSAVKSTASLKDMGEMFKYVAGAAAATGNSIDDTTAFAMAFSKNKVNGSDAGVALRSAIVRIATGGTKKGNEALERAKMPISNYQRGRQAVTSDRVLSGLMAGGIDAAPIKAQIDELLKDPGLANAPVRLAAKVTALVQEHLTKSGSALDAAVIAENVQESIIAAGSKIDLMRFFMDLKKKMTEGFITEGDLGKILEGRHFARYQALMQNDLSAIKADLVKNSDGFTEARYKIVLKGIVGPVYELTAALEGLATAMGRAVFTDIAASLKTITGYLTAWSEAAPGTLKFATYAGMALAVLAPLGIALASVVAGGGALVAIGKVLIGVVAAIAAFAGAPIWAVVAAIVAIGAAIAGAVVYWNKIGEWAAKADAYLADLGTRIGTAVSAAASNLYDAGVNLMSRLWEGMKSKFGELLSWVTSIPGRLKDAATGLISSGRGEASPPGRALGGNVTRGRAYVVGERRQELFFPGVSGTIHPSTNLAGGGGTSISLAPVFHIDGSGDPKAVAEQAYALFESRLQSLFRGLQADAGFRFA